MTQRDRWKKRPAVLRYREYADQLRLQAEKQDFKLGEDVEMSFFIPTPKSWSLRKSNLHWGYAHKQRPDIDNLIKAVMDALLEEDKKVYQITACKYWSVDGLIRLINKV